ncbi:DUF885 family protein [Streptomyces sp. NPDC091290]|uniref:DUF885 family protein n=1 Tax=Streptomyces sp. NPDC091290 TaxID=3365990 RepID=UPI003830D23E
MTDDASHELVQLAAEFWQWRARTQPDSFDDVPRPQRPADWAADWSAQAVDERRRQLARFTARHRALDLHAGTVVDRVDARLLRVALDKVHWELDLLRGWQRNPCFYIDQSLVPLYVELLAPPPFGEKRAAAIVRHLQRVPHVLAQGRDNLAGNAAAPFSDYALRLLADGPDNLIAAMDALAPLLPDPHRACLPGLARKIASHLAAYRDWLGTQQFTRSVAIGEKSLRFFLHRVALLPYTIEEMLDHARREYQRAVAMEAVWRRRAEHAAPPTARDSYIEHQRHQEKEVRRFCAERGLLDLSEALRRYRFALMPDYLDPLTWLGVPHYIASPDNPTEDAVRYVRAPQPDLPYFEQSKILDPRVGIVHEGVHAHQLALSWQHPNPARRPFYDSLPNEGIAFYNEELMLQAGLFDRTPASGAFLANGMRLRALRVHADLKLATGELTCDQAADLLARTLPLDPGTAWQETVFFAANPGQGLSYQIGKLQVLDLLTTASTDMDGFELRTFHNRLWREGNVPLVLQRLELLGRNDQLDRADQLGETE